MQGISRVIHYLFNRLSPIRYARWIGVSVGNDCRLIAVSYSSEPYLITLGDHVSASFVRFETHDGGVWILRESNPDCDIVKPIVVGNNVFIGFGAIILPGVTIGDNVVIGAQSVVTKDIPANTIAAGVPASVIKSKDEYEASCKQYIENTKRFSTADKRAFYVDKFN